jgi:DNA-binding MarR family transcriptional regulator
MLIVKVKRNEIIINHFPNIFNEISGLVQMPAIEGEEYGSFIICDANKIQKEKTAKGTVIGSIRLVPTDKGTSILFDNVDARWRASIAPEDTLRFQAFKKTVRDYFNKFGGSNIRMEAKPLPKKASILEDLSKLPPEEQKEILDILTTQSSLHNDAVPNNQPAAESFDNSRTEENTILPVIEDPTDKRIMELIDKNPSITDSKIAARLDITRQAVNARRTSLKKMGYRVRKVSRQK